MSNIAIKVSNLTKIYKLYDKPQDRLKEALHPLKKIYHKDFHALNNVNFEIKKGESVGIIGKNGAGKSTLLKIITGVLTPSNGQVNVNGRISSLLELGAGFNPEYTGLENIYLQGTLIGFTHEEMESKINEILAFADIGEFIHQHVKMYSSGMFARLAFAVAISVDPEILIVDEALSVGDSAFQRKCFSRMEEIRKKGTTIVFVSHSEGQIVELCSRAIFVHAGQIVLDGNPKIVTGLYSKMMNTNEVDIEAIHNEFIKLIETKESNQNDNKQENQQVEIDNKEDDFEEYFDENIVSQSLISYGSDGATINNVRLLTLDNKNVNVISSNRIYKYSYEVTFDRNVKNVRFGMMIKSVTGVGLTGYTYPREGLDTLSFKKNEKIIVSWEFENYYNDGIFLTNAGVHGLLSNNEIGFLHRIHDSLAFKSISKINNFDKGFYFNPKISIKLRGL